MDPINRQFSAYGLVARIEKTPSHIEQPTEFKIIRKPSRYKIVISNNSGVVDAIRCKVIDKRKESTKQWLKRQINLKLKNVIQIKEDKNTRVVISVRSIASHTGLKPKHVLGLAKHKTTLPAYQVFDLNFHKVISESKKLHVKSEQQYMNVIKSSPLRNPALLDAYNALPKDKKAKPNDCIPVRVFEFQQNGSQYCKMFFDEELPDLEGVDKGVTYNALVWNFDGKSYMDLQERYQSYDKQIDQATWKKIETTAGNLRKLSGSYPSK